MRFNLRCRFCTLTLAILMVTPAIWSAPKPPAPQAGYSGAPAQSSAQSSILKDLKNDWQHQKETMMAIAEAMPAGKFGYKTTPPQRDFGAQVMHVALVNVQLLQLLHGKSAAPSFTEQSVKTKADMLKAMSDSYDYGLALLKEQTDGSIVQTIPAPAFLGPSTRARIFWTLLAHSMDVYGQMAVYLRMNGVIPPESVNSAP